MLIQLTIIMNVVMFIIISIIIILLGRGGFGLVVKGIYYGTPVAVKLFASNACAPNEHKALPLLLWLLLVVVVVVVVVVVPLL